MKPNQNSNKKKLSLIKEKISSLSGNQMQNVVGGVAAGTIGGDTKSTVRNFTCTWCTHTSNSTDL
jgi:hypothetical protein